MADIIRLTVVGSQGEADIICGLLRSAGITCSERAADMPTYGAGGFGGWREILVEASDLAAARELLAARPGD